MKRPSNETETPVFRLFVYGTLKRGYWNHKRYCRDAVSIEEATVRGRLYELPSGIPVLEVPETDILAFGTDYPVVDARIAQIIGSTEPDALSTAWVSICGEIITFSEPSGSIPRIDRLEGFAPNGPSLYRRVLVPVRPAVGSIAVAWCYAGLQRIISSASKTGKRRWP